MSARTRMLGRNTDFALIALVIAILLVLFAPTRRDCARTAGHAY